MNRRKRKQPKTDYVALAKEKWSQIDWHAYLQKINLKQIDWQQWNRQRLSACWQRLPKLHQRALMVLVPVVLILMLVPVPEPKPQTEPESQRIELNINTTGLSEQSGQTASDAARQDAPKRTSGEIWKEYTVKKGDTLAQVFRNIGLPMTDLNALVQVEGSDKPLSQIKVGQLIRFKLEADGQLDILQLEKSSGAVMFFRLSSGGFGRSK